jgi:glutamate transport system substrate-binding protein
MSKAMARIGTTLFAACLILTACQANSQTQGQPNASQGHDGASQEGDVKVNVGVVTDEPGFNQLTPGSIAREGFDYKLYNWLGYRAPRLLPVPVDVTIEDRVNKLREGSVKLVVATFAITDERRKYVGFAGPYMLARQGIMVRSGDKRFHKIDDLAGKSVCVLSGSTTLERLNGLPYKMTITSMNGLSQCIARLLAGTDDVVTSDDVVLEGFARMDPTHLAIVKEVTFGNQERYGVGLPRGDITLCETVTAKLRDLLISNTWDDYFKEYFPDLSNNIAQYRPDPNQLDHCE